MLIRPARNEYRTWTLDSRRWSVFRPRAADIVIATAPKCGTTWMQQIVASLVFQDATPRAVAGVSPWIEARFRDDEATLARALEAQTHRRFLKTHLPFDGVPLYDEVRYIHVARAPTARRPIAIDPRIAFGRPIVVRGGVSTRAIAERIDAGETVAALAEDYQLAPAEIEEAVLYERAA